MAGANATHVNQAGFSKDEQQDREVLIEQVGFSLAGRWSGRRWGDSGATCNGVAQYERELAWLERTHVVS